MRLRMSVQQEHRRTFPRRGAVNDDTWLGGDVEAPEASQKIALCQVNLPIRFQGVGFNSRRRRSRSSDPSHLAIATVATPLPMRLVSARASDMKRSTPKSNAKPATGNDSIDDRVAANVMNPPPVTAADPLEVSSNMARMPSCSC